jgi:hypothetical protein
MALDERVRVRSPSGDNRHEFVERFGRVVRGIVCILEPADLSVEAAEHSHGVPVVVAMALAPQYAIAIDALDPAVDRARPDLACGATASQPACRVPGLQESAAFGALAERIGTLLAHAGGAAGIHNDARDGKRVEEAADALRCPAVGSRGAPAARVAARLERGFYVRYMSHRCMYSTYNCRSQLQIS